MGRIVAVDYGDKRIGIAISDSKKSIVIPLKTVNRDGFNRELANLLSYGDIELIVIGNPAGKDKLTKRLDDFVKKYILPLGIPYEFYDEKYSSLMALELVRDMGRSPSKARKSGIIDKLSAAIILKDYLRSKGFDVD